MSINSSLRPMERQFLQKGKNIRQSANRMVYNKARMFSVTSLWQTDFTSIQWELALGFIASLAFLLIGLLICERSNKKSCCRHHQEGSGVNLGSLESINTIRSHECKALVTDEDQPNIFV